VAAATTLYQSSTKQQCYNTKHVRCKPEVNTITLTTWWREDTTQCNTYNTSRLLRVISTKVNFSHHSLAIFGSFKLKTLL